MTKTELEQLSNIEVEIKLLEKKIQEAREERLHDVVTGSSPEFPFILHSVSISGLPEESYRLSDNEKKLINMKIKREKMKTKILDYINSVENSLVRSIMIAKYDSKRKVSWREVSQLIYGRLDKESSVKMILERYLARHKSCDDCDDSNC